MFVTILPTSTLAQFEQATTAYAIAESWGVERGDAFEEAKEATTAGRIGAAAY
jgi:hypothetical protein